MCTFFVIVSKDLKIFYAAKYLVAIGYRLLTVCVRVCVIVMNDMYMYHPLISDIVSPLATIVPFNKYVIICNETFCTDS